MGRFILFVIVLAVALPAVAQEDRDCSMWSVKDLHPGMTLEEARATGRTFHELKKDRDPLGYRRYVWQAPDKPEKIDLHVDVRVDPPIVIGVTTTVPSSDLHPRQFVETAMRRWGRPLDRSGQGAFTLYTWGSNECDVSVRASAMNQEHQVGVWVALSSITGREEYARRKREAAAAAEPAGGAGGANGAAGEPPAEPEPSRDE